MIKGLYFHGQDQRSNPDEGWEQNFKRLLQAVRWSHQIAVGGLCPKQQCNYAYFEYKLHTNNERTSTGVGYIPCTLAMDTII